MYFQKSDISIIGPYQHHGLIPVWDILKESLRTLKQSNTALQKLDVFHIGGKPVNSFAKFVRKFLCELNTD